MNLGIGLLGFGLLWAVSWRWAHGRGFRADRFVWSSAPAWLRKLARADAGPVLVWSLANQVWGLLLAGTGLAILLGFIQPASAVGAAYTAISGAILLAALALVIVATGGDRRMK